MDFEIVLPVLIGVCSFSGVGGTFLLEGKTPLPFSNQYRFTSGKVLTTRITNSRLGLFLPVRRWEMLDLCTPILSAKAEAVRP
jgi:hypothetical protein